MVTSHGREKYGPNYELVARIIVIMDSATPQQLQQLGEAHVEVFTDPGKQAERSAARGAAWRVAQRLVKTGAWTATWDTSRTMMLGSPLLWSDDRYRRGAWEAAWDTATAAVVYGQSSDDTYTDNHHQTLTCAFRRVFGEWPGGSP